MKPVPPAPPSRAEYRILGMDCAEEVAILRGELGHRTGVTDLQFDVLRAKMMVEYNSDAIAADDILRAVERTGMKAEPWRDEVPPPTYWQRNGRVILTAISGSLFLAAMIWQGIESGNLIGAFLAHEHGAGHSHRMAWIQMALCLGAIFAGSVFIVPKALYSLRRLEPDMNALVMISLIGAVYLGEWLEGSSLAFLFALAGLLEMLSLARARNAVTSLMQVAPGDAAVVHGDHEHRVPVDKVAVGSLVRVRPGERIPFDGEVAAGASDVNQATITGESLPVWKGPGDSVFAGTINGDGLLDLYTSKLASDTTLARIIRMVEEAQHRRAPAERFVERFARIYTPAMLVLALAVAILPPLAGQGTWGGWFYQGMVILLISCPCALVISTPVTVAAALASAARNGLLVKGGAYLEEAAQVRVVAFDKTGVLTRGDAQVTELRPLNNYTGAQVLERLAAVERSSQHPLARAVVRFAEAQGIRAREATGFQSVQGKGAEADVEGETFWAGSLRLAGEKGLVNDALRGAAAEMSGSEGILVVCGTNREPWALLSLTDPVRSDAPATIRELREIGISRVVMLTGDTQNVADAVGKAVGVDELLAGLLPGEKADAVDKLKARHGHLAMVGDGINDAQAMTRSTLGIAMGSSGVDAVIETADVVLLAGGLQRLPFLFRHARRTVAIIRENIIFALGLKGVFLVMAMFGLATLWMAVAADMGATLLVTFNGLRMLRVSRRDALT